MANSNNTTDYSQEYLCGQNAKVLIYKLKKICKLLNIKPSPKVLNLIKEFKKNGKISSKISITKYKNRCRIKNSIQLEGYYIAPTDSDLTITNNYLSFAPLWLIVIGSTCIEIKDNPVTIQHNQIGVLPIGQNPCQAHIIGYNQSQNTFCHNDLQFSELTVEGFDQGYISYYELFAIAQNAKYLSIVGARVSSGNIVGLDGPPNYDMIHDCNVNYFTYRILGLNSFRCNSRLADQNNTYYLKSNWDKTSNTPDHNIPAETWAVPCPPRWVPA